MNKIIIFFIFISVPFKLLSQIIPKEGARLHYRIVGFTFPAVRQINNYKLEVSLGNFNSEDSFRKHIVLSLSDKKNKIIAEVPYFGSQYTWRVVHNAEKNTRGFHHFSTNTIPGLDTNTVRFRVITPAIAYKDAYVFLDGNKAMYDLNGHPVWYLPAIDGPLNENAQLGDMKLTPQGTITLLLNNRAYEINYNGDVLWKGPDNGTVNGDTSEHYHHDFTRLNNGHYMVLGSEAVLWKHELLPDEDSDFIRASAGRMKKDTNVKTNFGTVIEYDEKGNVVWSWKSAKYFMGSDVKYFNPHIGRNIIDVHENAFFFDEKEHNVYVSFKNISRIVKVKYPDGKVINSYGEIYKPGVPDAGNGLFCSQHSCKRSADGLLYLFNNNNCGDEKQMPTVIMMREPAPGKDSLEKMWEYVCTAEGIDNTALLKIRMEQERMAQKDSRGFPRKKLLKVWPTSGGNVAELPDHTLFVSMNNEYSKIFIVNRDKKILWSAVPEKWSKAEKRWVVILQYRASIITSHKELESLIWNNRKQ